MGLLKSKNQQEYKYCPICGTPAKLTDAYCMRCGQSLQQNRLKKKGIKWKNLIIVIIALVVLYFGLRYTAGQSIIPTSLADALDISFKAK